MGKTKENERGKTTGMYPLPLRLEIKKMSGRKFATSYENLVAT